MKSTVKFLTIAAMVLLMAAAFVNAEPQDNDKPGDEQIGGDNGPGGERIGAGGFEEKMLEDIRAKDPNEAARIEKLRENSPDQFRMEIREFALKNMRTGMPNARFERKGRREGMPGIEARDGGKGPGMERGRQRLGEMEGELMTWLTKNEPAEANSLALLKGKDPQAYMRKIMIDTKKYRQIMETETSNPALAEILKKELKLKEQRNELLEKFKAATDDKKKGKIKAELKDVIGQMFDVKLQKKQIRYEELKTKLEELQKNVDKSQTELDKFKNDKDAQVDKYLESIISQSGQFDWD
jgi:hypothetical protein